MDNKIVWVLWVKAWPDEYVVALYSSEEEAKHGRQRMALKFPHAYPLEDTLIMTATLDSDAI